MEIGAAGALSRIARRAGKLFVARGASVRTRRINFPESTSGRGQRPSATGHATRATTYFASGLPGTTGVAGTAGTAGFTPPTGAGVAGLTAAGPGAAGAAGTILTAGVVYEANSVSLEAQRYLQIRIRTTDSRRMDIKPLVKIDH